MESELEQDTPSDTARPRAPKELIRAAYSSDKVDTFKQRERRLKLRSRILPTLAALAAILLIRGLATGHPWQSQRAPDLAEVATTAHAAADADRDQEGNAQHTPQGTSEHEHASAIKVHVSGAVASPGLYELDAGARVDDAIRAAGGPTQEADTSGLNLAAVVPDAVHINVPKQGETASGFAADPPAPVTGPKTASPGGGSSGSGPMRVDVNTAQAQALQVLPGVGPALSAKIVSYRDKHGRFKSLDALSAIPGISAKRIDAWRDLAVAR